MKPTFILCVFLLFSTVAFSVPARPILVKFQQPNGKEISVYLLGDEKVHWMKSSDGYSLLYDKNQFIVYAIQDEEGNMVPSDIVAQDVSLRSSAIQDQIKDIPKNLKYSAAQIDTMKKKWAKPNFQENKVPKLRSSTAQKTRTLCVLANFKDKQMLKSKSNFESLLNQVGYNLDGARGSVHDFFLENSYGQIDMEITVLGPFTAAQNMAYYGENDKNDTDKNPWELAREAARYAFSQPGINPADYDNDGDGYIDALHIIYAGYGEEAGGEKNTIWAHESRVQPMLFGGKLFSVYSCSPELQSNSGSNLTHIGVICHEMGHVFGAPDFYDVDYVEGGEYLGTGKWDLMANGSWNGNGACPAHINMYMKIELGWVNPILLDMTKSNNNIDMENSAKNPVACIFSTPVSGEYYVLENRQKEGFDSSIPGTGLLIYHVSLTGDDISDNEVNNTHPQKMYPVCASATVKVPNSSASSYGSINSPACPFPGTFGKTSFTDLTTPASLTWNGEKADGLITDIRELNKVISFNYTYTGTDIKFLPSNETNVHPNPVQRGEFVTIDTGNHSGNGILSVYSISGQKLTEEHFSDKIIRKKMDLTPGVYILQIQKNRQVTNRKIVIK